MKKLIIPLLLVFFVGCSHFLEGMEKKINPRPEIKGLEVGLYETGENYNTFCWVAHTNEHTNQVSVQIKSWEVDGGWSNGLNPPATKVDTMTAIGCFGLRRFTKVQIDVWGHKKDFRFHEQYQFDLSSL